MECYRQYIHHFKSRFLNVSAQTFTEGAINVGITNDTLDQTHNQKEEAERSPILENWKNAL